MSERTICQYSAGIELFQECSLVGQELDGIKRAVLDPVFLHSERPQVQIMTDHSALDRAVKRKSRKGLDVIQDPD
jgi:hypothetical protein